MTHAHAIVLLTLAGIGLGCAWFCRRRIELSTTGDFFMLAWLYYALAVPLDLIFGFSIRALPGSPDFTEPELQAVIARSLALYLSCAVAFIGTYTITRGGSASLSHKEPAVLPPALWLMIIVHLLALTLFRGDYLFLTRQERALLLAGSWSFKLTTLTLAAIKALDLIYIITSRSVRHSLAVAALAMALGLIAGDRSDVLIVVVCFVLKWRLSFRRSTFAAGLVGGLLLLASWKLLYAVGVNYYVSGQWLRDLNWRDYMNLSGIDAYCSFLILTTYLEDPCPYWMGRSYVIDPVLMSIPSEWRSDSVMTLAQQYAVDYVPWFADRGGGTGFSAVAESWLNFGAAGPALLGAAWGWVSKRLDQHRRAVPFYIFALMTCRLFRSDFASLWKSWIVIYGGSMFAFYLLLRVTQPRRRSAGREADEPRPARLAPLAGQGGVRP